MADILSLLNILAQYGIMILTLAMVIISSINIFHTKKQLELFRKQTIIMRNQNSPIIIVKEVKFNGNSIEVDIQNKGMGVAIDLGIEANFHLGTFIKEKETTTGHYGRFSYDSTPLHDKFNTQIYDNGYVNFAKETDGRPVYIAPSESKKITITPEFFGWHGKGWLSSGQIITLDELITSVQKASKQFVGLSFNLTYKDINEQVQNDSLIKKFIFNVNKHKTLQEANNDSINFSYVSLGHDEIISMGGLPTKTYNRIVSNRNSAKAEDSDPMKDLFG